MLKKNHRKIGPFRGIEPSSVHPNCDHPKFFISENLFYVFVYIFDELLILLYLTNVRNVSQELIVYKNVNFERIFNQHVFQHYLLLNLSLTFCSQYLLMNHFPIQLLNEKSEDFFCVISISIG